MGSPTHGGRPTAALQAWLGRIPVGSLDGVRVAAFDTRMSVEQRGVLLYTLMRLIGFAATPILRRLEAAGGAGAGAGAGAGEGEGEGEGEGFIV